MVQGLGFRFRVHEFRVEGRGIGFPGLGSEVQGLEFRV